MARGPKKHLKRLNVPKHWMLSKMEGIWAPRPSQGPHKLRESMPLILILRNRLKYALTGKETKMICMERHVKVDGKIRTDPNFPAGFGDVIEIPKAGDQFRLLFDAKGRYVLHRISAEETKFKLCRVKRQELTLKKIPFIVTHDGRTIRYPDPDAKVGDTVKVDIASGKILAVLKNEAGKVAMVTKGRSAGCVGVVLHVEHHPGSFDIVTCRDASGKTFSTRKENVFIIGTGAVSGSDENSTEISLPKGKGIKLTILEEREHIARKLNKE